MERLSSSGHELESAVSGLSSSLSDESNGSTRRSGSSTSKKGITGRGPPPGLDLSRSGPRVRQFSPDEISGKPPALSLVSPTTAAAMKKITNQYSNPQVRPMGFGNGPAPDYPWQVCYRNATISMLLNLPYFTNWLSGDHERPESPRNTIFDSLRRLAEEYWSHDVQVEGGESPIDAINAKQERLDDKMNEFWNYFLIAAHITQPPHNIYAQDDAYDFLSQVLTLAIHKPDEISSSSSENTPGSEIPRRTSRTDASLLESIFKIRLARSTFCREWCYEKRVRKEGTERQDWSHFVTFENPLIQEAERTFQDCFSASLKDQQSDVNCDKCGKKTNRSVRDEFLELPKILLTRFNRLTPEGIKKEDYGEVSLELTVPIDKSARKNYKNPRYRLVGVVAHAGETDQQGHYISYVRDPATEGGWIELNDSQVRSIPFAEVNHNRASETEEMLPYIMAWELLQDETEEQRLIRELAEKAKALDEREERLKRLEDALNTTERELEQRQQNSQIKIKKDSNDFKHKKSILTGQFNQSGKTSIEQEVDERKDTATFCASFRNVDNHDENARAIFKLNNFNPNIPTKIESTVQLSDLEGNLQAIKKGTTVADGFTITFNVKGGRKRKGQDGDEAGLLTRPRKKPRVQPQRSSGEVIRSPRNVTPPGSRRSTRSTKGKHSRRS